MPAVSHRRYNSHRIQRYSCPYGTPPGRNDITLSTKSIIKGHMVSAFVSIYAFIGFKSALSDFLHVFSSQNIFLRIYPIIGALIVYDITDLESWSKVSKWVKELQMYLPQDTPIIITGNKCDIPNRQIPIDEAERYR